MIELRFHKELYSGFAVDEALKVFADYATFEQADETASWVVRLTTTDASVEERTIANEFANYALGLTIERAEIASNSSTETSSNGVAETRLDQGDPICRNNSFN